MAVTFSYRSKKDKANLEIRLSFRIEGKNLNEETGKEMPFSFYTRSQIEVEKVFWKEYKNNTNFKDESKIALKRKIDDHIANLSKFIDDHFEKHDPATIGKDWLKDIVSKYYNPTKLTKGAPPEHVLPYFDYFLNLRRHKIKGRTRQRWVTIRNKFKEFQDSRSENYEIKNVDEEFSNLWIDYCEGEGYADKTIQKEFSRIKTICKHAKSKGVKASPELDSLVIASKPNDTPIIYLSFKDLEKIKAVDNLPPYLDNARDFLVLSCYVGQRISDFMRFEKSMIRKVKDKTFIDIEQVKTGKKVTIPMLPSVLDILKKREGSFPKPISEQNYNLYIKEVAKRAGLTKPTKGGKRINNRKVIGTYPKWELISSHIGRRSFCSNYYGEVPTTYLKNITGHGTEEMLLAYIGKTSKDTAIQSYDLLMKLNN